jgi:glucan 1,3-beta-glucosidase
LDTHIYHVFDYGLLNFTNDQHISFTCGFQRDRIEKSNKITPTFVGEWSLARTDCTKWLNGFGKGSRFDGTLENTTSLGSCGMENNHQLWSVEYRQGMKKFVEAQMDSYENGAGWFFWNFKAENASHWDFLLGVKEGWIPKDISKREFKCNPKL